MTDAKDRPVFKQFPSADKQTFKRPDHPDFLTTSELKKAEFSGLRNNSITNDMEIWILGEIVKIVTKQMVAADPEALNKAYAEVFALEDVKFYNPSAN